MRNYLTRFHFLSRLLLLTVPPMVVVLYLTIDKLINSGEIKTFALNISIILGLILTTFYVSKELYAEIKEQQKALLQQSKMAAMGEMIAAISHQWRQPINAVGVLAQEIKYKCDMNLFKEDELKTLTNNLLDHLDYMSTTIDDFRNFFKPDKQKKSFDIKKAIVEALRIVSKQLEMQGIKIIIEEKCNISKAINSESIYKISGYENEFKQVIINLINNAREAIEENIKNNPLSKREITIIIERDVSDLIIYVRDSGGGIKKELLDSLFDIYISSKHKRQGTGLGLYISKLIIERNMLGTIRAKNREDGAEFEIFLTPDSTDF